MRQIYTGLLLLLFSYNYAQVTCDDEFLLVGSATEFGDCIRLTPSSPAQQGCAWFPNQIDFTQPFTHSMTVNFGTVNANGADGICMIYQTNSTSICGIGGGGIGVQGIPNSFIIEMDTWDNGVGFSDIPNDHIAIDVNGDNLNAINGPFDLGNIEDGNDHTVDFTWDPSINSYLVRFDGNLVLSGTYDIINLCFGGATTAFWGFTSSTGAATNVQQICPEMPPEVIADAGADLTLPCAGSSLTLDGTASDFGPEFTYTWTTSDGNIVSGANTATPTINAPGTYTLTILNTTTNCEEMDEVVVDQNDVEAVLDDPPFLDCVPGFLTLDGSSSTAGNNITYQWSTIGGNITSENGTQATVDAPGTYTLTVVYDDGVNICTDEATVQVLEDPNEPVAFAFDEELPCEPSSIQLDGSGSSQGSAFSYSWTTPNGAIISGQNTLFPTIGATGSYILTVTNLFTGCTDDFDVFVTPDQTLPLAIANVNGSLSCNQTQLTIDGTGSSEGNDFTYEWTTAGGNIVSEGTTLYPIVDAEGDYTLIVTDQSNGCTDQITVLVQDNSFNPNAEISMPDELTCTTVSVVLDGSGSDQGVDYSYTWITTNGQIDGPTDGIQATAVAPGEYTLTVLNTTNNCEESATVTVVETATPPFAEAGIADPLGCGDASTFLDGSASSSANDDTYSYQWTTVDGNILNGATTFSPEVNSVGIYTLEVTNTLTGCTATDEVVVDGDADTPVVSIIVSDTLDCVTDQVLLNANNSSQGNDYTFVWSTVGGNITMGQNTLQPTVDEPGTYTLAITNVNNDCTSDLSVMVIADEQAPVAMIAMPDQLDCDNATTLLDATASSPTNLGFQWTTLDGSISNGATTATPTVEQAGTYQLEVVNTGNGCSSMASVMVSQDTVAPTVTIGTPAMLNCNVVQTTLDASGSSQGNSFTYSWTSPDGNILAGNTTLSPSLDAPGTYQLEVTDGSNGCSNSMSVTVVQDTLAPTVLAGEDGVLNCSTPVQTIGSNATSSGPQFTYTWSSPNGQFVAPTDSLVTQASAMGLYILEVQNTTNFCSASDTLSVSEDFATPTALANAPDLLTCTDSLVMLDATASSSGMGISYAWSTTNGSIVSGQNTTQPTVSQAGDYQLIVLNNQNGCSDTTLAVVNQDENFPEAMIVEPEMLTCVSTEVDLIGTANSQSGNLDFEWMSTDGNFTAGTNSLQPTVDAPGTYLLQVTDLDNNCQALAAIEVILDDEEPVTTISTPQVLTCVQTEQTLQAENPDVSGNYTYSWSTPDGNILAGSDGVNPDIDAPGTYEVLVTNIDNGCTLTTDVLVTENVTPPVLTIAAPAELNCSLTSQALDATNSDTDPNFQFEWSTSDGDIIAGAATPEPTIGGPGMYSLLLTNTDNGCTTTDQVVVTEDIQIPTVVVNETDELTCSTTNVTLSSAGTDTGPNFQLAWTTADGNITSGTNIPEPTADAPGFYWLTVTNTLNNCVDSSGIAISQDTLSPSISLAEPVLLTCVQTEQILEAENQNTTGNYSYLWSTVDGNIVAGAASVNPQIDAPGTYALLATNTDNDCVLMTDVLVMENITPPVLTIATPAELNCTLSSQTLDATNSDTAVNFQFEWSTTDGDITADGSTPEPTIAEPGIYSLLITNTINGCTNSDQVVVTEDTQLPAVLVDEAEELTCTTTSVTLSSTGTDTGPNFQLAWTTVDGNLTSATDIPAPTADAPGFYVLTVTNMQNGCIDSSGVAISQDTLSPSIVIAEPALLTCVTQSTPLDASASSTQGTAIYQWTTTDGQLDSGEDSAISSVSVPGTYTLNLTDTDNGCVTIEALTVGQDTILPLASIAPAEVLTCATPTLNLDASASSTLGNFMFTWSTPDGNILAEDDELFAQIDSPGEYVFEIENEDTGCSNSTSIQVSQDTISPTISIANPDLLDCQLTSFNLDATGSSEGTGFSITWTTQDGQVESGANTLMPVINEPGEYELVILNTDNGCSNNASVLVEQDDDVPVVNVAEPETLTCLLQAINLDAATSSQGDSFSINWTTTDGQIQEGVNTLNPVIVEPGTYVLSILNTDNMCENSTSVTVAENVVPPVADAGLDFTLSCFTLTSALDGSGSSQNGPYSYEWTALEGVILDGEQNLNPTIDGPGVFELMIVNTENGCVDNDLVTVDQDIPLAAVATAEPLCYGDPGSLFVESVVGGTAPYVYSINNGQSFQTTATFGNLPAGQYDLVVQDLNGCEYLETVLIDQPDSLAVVITEPEVVIELGDSHAIFAQVNVPVDSLVSISWEDNGSLSCTDCLTPIARPLETSVYRITVQTANGCTDQAILRLFVENDRAVYIPNAFSPDGDGQNDFLMIFARLGAVENIRQFKVYNRWGEPVFSAFDFQPNDPSAGWDGIFRGQPVNPAVYVYFAEVEYADGTVEIIKGDVAVVR